MKWGLGDEEGEMDGGWVGGENKAMEMDMIWLGGGLGGWSLRAFDGFFWGAILSPASEMAKLLVSTLYTFAASMIR